MGAVLGKLLKNNTMEEEKKPEAIFSTSVSASGKTYFFDVKQAKAGKQSKYVQITESRMQEGQRIRSSVTVFPDHIKAFFEALQAAMAKVD